MKPKFILGNLNSAFLGVVQHQEQVSVLGGGEDALKDNLCVFISVAFHHGYFGLGVDRLVRGNDLKDTA